MFVLCFLFAFIGCVSKYMDDGCNGYFGGKHCYV